MSGALWLKLNQIFFVKIFTSSLLHYHLLAVHDVEAGLQGFGTLVAYLNTFNGVDVTSGVSLGGVDVVWMARRPSVLPATSLLLSTLTRLILQLSSLLSTLLLSRLLSHRTLS